MGPQKRPILPTPWSWTPSFQNHEKKKFSCLTHLVCGYFVKAALTNWHTPPSDLGYITHAPIWSGKHAGQSYGKKAVSSPETRVSILIHWFSLPSQSKRDGFASPDLKQHPGKDSFCPPFPLLLPPASNKQHSTMLLWVQLLFSFLVIFYSLPWSQKHRSSLYYTFLVFVCLKFS